MYINKFYDRKSCLNETEILEECHTAITTGRVMPLRSLISVKALIIACQAPIHMPVIRERRRGHRASRDDPTYEARIQEALKGVLCGKYINFKQAADDLCEYLFSALSLIFLRVFFPGRAIYTQRSCS